MLNMGNLDPAGTEGDRPVDHSVNAADIGAMDNGIDRERKRLLGEPDC
jgi:hypothetical protein